MNVSNLTRTKKLVVFGAGLIGKMVAESLPGKISYFVDNNRHGKAFFGFNVLPPDVLCGEDKENLFIIIATDKYYLEIASQLDDMGFSKHKHFSIFFPFFPFEAFSADYPMRRLLIALTDSCNSRCVMCNIWQNAPGRVVSMDTYKRLLYDPFFLNTRQFRISGGEPTLAKNLPEFARVAIDALPSLDEIVLNFNGLLVDRSLRFIKEISQDCEPYGISVTLSLSLNGIGDAHDGNRGVPGNYDKCMQVIAGVRAMKLPNVFIHISSRIVKDNVWNMDEFAVMLKRENLVSNNMLLTGRLLALKNEEYAGIGELDDDERYQVKLLCHKLPHFFPTEYTSTIYPGLFNSLQTGKRVVKCFNQNGNDLALAYNGIVRYCQVFSRDIGNIQNSDIRSSFRTHTLYLNYLSQVQCSNCYCCGAMVPDDELVEIKKSEKYWKDFYELEFYYRNVESFKEELTRTPNRDSRKTVLITGWYGTETVGDKAILRQILTEIRNKDKEARILITSAYPFITHRTLHELEEVAEVVPLYDRQSLQWAAMADEVVMGGGPLMETEWLAIPLWLFSIAKRSGGKTIVRGCGVGPIFSEKAEKAVSDILCLADEITLRDKASANWATAQTGRADILVTDDPSVPYIRARYKKKAGETDSREIACFLREITPEYYRDRSEKEFNEYRTGVEAALARNIKELCARENLLPCFYSMHNFVIGNDDRDFYYRFAHSYFEKGTYRIDNKLTSVEKVTTAMNAAALCLCMRFHSVVFADTLEVPYLAFDYTNGGKITAFLKEREKEGQVATADDLIRSDVFLHGMLTTGFHANHRL